MQSFKYPAAVSKSINSENDINRSRNKTENNFDYIIVYLKNNINIFYIEWFKQLL